MKFFKNISENLNFVSDDDKKIQLILESPEDIERELNINRKDYATKEQRINLLGKLAFVWTDYVYSKDALADFFGISKAALTHSINASGVGDKILLEK